MRSLSKKEVQLIADLEFRQQYYFTREDIASHFANKKQLTDTLYKLKKKGRILRLNRNKYYLIPIKAREGAWADHPLIVADELMNGKDYVIGGWYAAYYWGLTEQVPFQVDIYTTKRQGAVKMLGKRFVFHRTTPARVERGEVQNLAGHPFRIVTKAEAERWLQSRK